MLKFSFCFTKEEFEEALENPEALGARDILMGYIIHLVLQPNNNSLPEFNLAVKLKLIQAFEDIAPVQALFLIPPFCEHTTKQQEQSIPSYAQNSYIITTQIAALIAKKQHDFLEAGYIINNLHSIANSSLSDYEKSFLIELVLDFYANYLLENTHKNNSPQRSNTQRGILIEQLILNLNSKNSVLELLFNNACTQAITLIFNINPNASYQHTKQALKQLQQRFIKADKLIKSGKLTLAKDLKLNPLKYAAGNLRNRYYLNLLPRSLISLFAKNKSFTFLDKEFLLKYWSGLYPTKLAPRYLRSASEDERRLYGPLRALKEITYTRGHLFWRITAYKLAWNSSSKLPLLADCTPERVIGTDNATEFNPTEEALHNYLSYFNLLHRKKAQTILAEHLSQNPNKSYWLERILIDGTVAHDATYYLRISAEAKILIALSTRYACFHLDEGMQRLVLQGLLDFFKELYPDVQLLVTDIKFFNTLGDLARLLESFNPKVVAQYSLELAKYLNDDFFSLFNKNFLKKIFAAFAPEPATSTNTFSTQSLYHKLLNHLMNLCISKQITHHYYYLRLKLFFDTLSIEDKSVFFQDNIHLMLERTNIEDNLCNQYGNIAFIFNSLTLSEQQAFIINCLKVLKFIYTRNNWRTDNPSQIAEVAKNRAVCLHDLMHILSICNIQHNKQFELPQYVDGDTTINLLDITKHMQAIDSIANPEVVTLRLCEQTRDNYLKVFQQLSKLDLPEEHISHTSEQLLQALTRHFMDISNTEATREQGSIIAHTAYANGNDNYCQWRLMWYFSLKNINPALLEPIAVKIILHIHEKLMLTANTQELPFDIANLTRQCLQVLAANDMLTDDSKVAHLWQNLQQQYLEILVESPTFKPYLLDEYVAVAVDDGSGVQSMPIPRPPAPLATAAINDKFLMLLSVCRQFIDNRQLIEALIKIYEKMYDEPTPNNVLLSLYTQNAVPVRFINAREHGSWRKNYDKVTKLDEPQTHQAVSSQISVTSLELA